MDGGWSGLAAAYEAALQRYVDAGGEVELEAAHAFSREAFGEEMTVLDVVGLHRRVVERLSGRTSSVDVELISASFSDVVKRVDALLHELGTGEIATMVYVVADPGRGRLVVANAGHPPPVVVEPNGASRRVEIAHGRLLGLRPSLSRRADGVTQISSGGHLLLYTDGLIEPLERAGHDGIAELCRLIEGFTGTAQQLCERVLGELAPEGALDDICVVAATLTAHPRRRRLARRAPRQSHI